MLCDVITLLFDLFLGIPMLVIFFRIHNYKFLINQINIVISYRNLTYIQIVMNINRKKLTQRIIKETTTKEYPMLNLYVLVVIMLTLLGQYIRSYLPIIKPIPILLMIFYIHLKNSQRDHLVANLVGKGLIISLIGDVFGIVQGKDGVTLLIICYTFSYLLNSFAFVLGCRIKRPSITRLILMWIGAIFLLTLFSTYYIWNWQNITQKLFSVLSGVMLLLMVLLALFRYSYTTTYSYYFILFGSIMIMCSNIILLLVKFNSNELILGIVSEGVIINLAKMILYYGGNYLVMHGSLHHSHLQHAIEYTFRK